MAASANASGLAVEVLSGRADLVSGGDALVAVDLPTGTDASQVGVKLGSQDVTSQFALRPNGRFEALLGGLALGASSVTATIPNGPSATLTITNHDNGGPVFSGPQLPHWSCEGGATDAKCDRPPEYDWLYASTNPSKAGLQSYDPANPPSDVATTTTDTGQTVQFIVRQEVDYQDRDQVKILTLRQPAESWDRWAPPAHFNHKLLITHGGGCGGDYSPGGAPLNDFSGTIPSSTPGYTQSYITALGRGFGVMSTALDNNGHDCNLVLQAESLIMAKEYFLKRYGDLRYTIGTGCSGGSIAQQHIANAYPNGVYDGLIVTCAFPDDISTGAEFADYDLLRRYFESPQKWGAGVAWTPSQWAAVEGRPDPVNAIVADEEFFKSATNPVGGCVASQYAYNPTSNPGGVRCSILDYMINVLGPRPQSVWSPMEQAVGHGFAGQPFGNAGIQYGLGSLQSGLITPDQFIDLNAKIGGGDIDLNPTPQRLQGDPGALANAYRSGAINEANNMGTVAIIDHGGPDPGAAHDFVHTWWMRDRLDRVFGNHDNHVLWFGPTPILGDPTWPTEALTDMDRWLNAVRSDTSSASLQSKIVTDKPADVHDRCEYVPGINMSPTDDVCLPGELQTRYSTPRGVAGEGEANDNNACRLRPVSASDYFPLAMSAAQLHRIRAIFPNGVCDFSKGGVGQQPTIPWQTYQTDAAGSGHIYGGTPMGTPPSSTIDYSYTPPAPDVSVGVPGVGHVNVTVPQSLKPSR